MRQTLNKDNVTNKIMSKKKEFWDRLDNPNSKHFIINLIALFLIVLLCITIILYVISTWNNPDKIYNLIINILTLITGFIGGKALSNDKN